MHARVVFHFADQRPVGFSRVHLCTGTSVDGQCGNAAVLQLLGQIDDDLMVGIPAQPGFYGNRYFHGIYYGAGDFKHFRNILQHSGTGAFSGYFLYGASEVDVQYVGTCFFYDSCGSYHGFGVFTVYLYGNGAFFIANRELLRGFIDRTYQCVARNKLGVYHICSKLFTHQTESGIGHILHRG